MPRWLVRIICWLWTHRWPDNVDIDYWRCRRRNGFHSYCGHSKWGRPNYLR